MTARHKKASDGLFHIHGKKFNKLIGSRAEVMHRTAYKTSGGKVKGRGGDALLRKHLKYNKNGKIVSRAKSSKKGKLLAQLKRAGYTTKKGKFGAVKINKTLKKKSRRRRKKK
jgi:hypothetical protein|tara:strand:- start:201 stop:539 length:339 start_codon:yes stop_codon:yes gene_type:complete